ncbi:MAG: MFS transporter, partial [Planctomycetaceae bacterium]|nr:MFS transporter [Planctomycetaceae bacterium]
NADELALVRAGRESNDRDQVDGKPVISDNDSFDLLTVACSPAMLWLCGQQICRASGYMFFASWFPTFLQETRGVSVAKSGYLQGLVFAGTLAGCIFGGIMTDWIWRRTGGLSLSRSAVGAASLGACSFLILVAWFVKSPELAVALLTLGSFFAALAGPAAFAAVIDIGGPRVPQVFGLMNMIGNFAAAACPFVVGKLFELTTNWNLVLLLFAGVYFAGAVCWVFVNPPRQAIKTTSKHRDSDKPQQTQ